MALGRLEVEWGKNLILLTQFSVALTFLFKYAPFASWDSQMYVLKGFGPIFIAHIFVKVQEYFHGFFFLQFHYLIINPSPGFFPPLCFLYLPSC